MRALGKPPDAGAAHLVDVGVPRIERTDDEFAAPVDVHVLVLPIAVRAEDVRGLECVEKLRPGRIADVQRLEAEPTREDQHVPTAGAVELALDDHARSGDPCDVFQ